MQYINHKRLGNQFTEAMKGGHKTKYSKNIYESISSSKPKDLENVDISKDDVFPENNIKNMIVIDDKTKLSLIKNRSGAYIFAKYEINKQESGNIIETKQVGININGKGEIESYEYSVSKVKKIRNNIYEVTINLNEKEIDEGNWSAPIKDKRIKIKYIGDNNFDIID